jgi:hypothetical protein
MTHNNIGEQRYGIRVFVRAEIIRSRDQKTVSPRPNGIDLSDHLGNGRSRC